MTAPFPVDSLFELYAGLLRVKNVNDYFDVVGSWIPSVLHIEHHNLIIVNLRAQLYLRHFSPGFPTHIFHDYTSDAAASDLMLQRGMVLEPGEVMHLAALCEEGEAPEGWSRLDHTFRERSRFIDSIAVVLHKDLDLAWGAGLVLYRTVDQPIFQPEEVALAQRLGPVLAAGFHSAWSSALISASHEALTDIFFNFGNLSFLVTHEAEPVLVDEPTERALELLYGEPPLPRRLPAPLGASIRELIDLMRTNPRMSLVVGDTRAPSGQLRLYVKPQPEVAGQGTVFLVVVMCAPGFADLSLLQETGLSARQVEILSLLQRGLCLRDIARDLHISDNTVKYHFKAIGENLGASGKSEILSRAIARGIELAIEHGISRRRSNPGLPVV